MKESGHEVVFRWQPNYDVLLASPRAPLWMLLDAKLRGKKIIQRLDGVYTPRTAAGRWWRLHNLPLSIIRTYFAGKIIYQSEFSQQQCNKYLFRIPNTKSQTSRKIYNGVDNDMFSPEGPAESLRENPDQHVFITWSRFRRADQVDPLLKAFHYYHEHIEKNSKLVLIGNVPNQLKVEESPRPRVAGAGLGAAASSVPGISQGGGASTSEPAAGAGENEATVIRAAGDSGVNYLESIPNENIPRYARGADVFVISHLNPPCPNNVIEAMACGLTIAGTDTGAMPELVTNNGLLLDVNDSAAFAEAMQQAWQRRQELGQRSRARATEKFALTEMTQKYAEALVL